MDARERSAWSTAVARQIRAERAARGWSQGELVERTGIPKSTLRRLESGERVQDVTQIYKIASVFGLDLPEFFSRAQDRLEDE